MSEILELKSQLSEALDRIALLEKAPMLHRYIADATLVKRTKASFVELAALLAAGPDERAIAIRKMPAATTKELVGLAAREERVAMLRDVDPTVRALITRWLDPGEAIYIAVALMDEDALPDLVEIRNTSQMTLGWSRYDERSRHAGGRSLLPNETAIQPRGEYERDVATMEELRDALKTNRVVCRALDEAERRDWLRKAVQNGVRYAWSAASLTITPLVLDVPVGTDAELASSKKSIAAVRAADKKSLVQSGEATMAALKANGKLRTESK